MNRNVKKVNIFACAPYRVAIGRKRVLNGLQRTRLSLEIVKLYQFSELFYFIFISDPGSESQMIQILLKVLDPIGSGSVCCLKLLSDHSNLGA
jgi:hypothetical protein